MYITADIKLAEFLLPVKKTTDCLTPNLTIVGDHNSVFYLSFFVFSFFGRLSRSFVFVETYGLA